MLLLLDQSVLDRLWPATEITGGSMPMWSCLEKVVAIAGGCVVASTGAVDPGTIVGGAMGAAGLLGFWREGKGARGPESIDMLGAIREQLLAEIETSAEWASFEPALREAADYHLGRALADCRLDRNALARSAVTAEGFPRAATAIWLDALAEREPLFAVESSEADPAARRFAALVIERALRLTWADREFFAQFQPDLLRWMAQAAGETREDVRRIGAGMDHVRATTDDTAADVKRLLEAFDATAAGKRARREIGDNRPFVVLARRINQEVDDPNQALAELTSMVELVLRQQAEAGRGSNLGDLVDSALMRIAEKSRRGEFDSAAEEAAGAFADWERREAERHQAELRAGMRLIEANIEQNLLRRDAEQVAVWIDRSLSLEKDSGVADAAALMEAFESWYDRGNMGGFKLEMEVAASVAQLAVSRSENDAQRGVALNALGETLSILGERASDTMRLVQAVEVYQQALGFQRRPRAPLDWALTQANLGVALRRLGDREHGTGRLEAAVDAFRLALEEYSREFAPQRWAATQNSLGIALQVLGQRQSNFSLLEASLVAFRASMEVWSRENEPRQWALAQANIGNTLWAMDQQAKQVHRLDEAVVAYSLALEEIDRAGDPLGWATTQDSLGNVFATLGERELSPPRFEMAIASLRAALEERTRDRIPFWWAATQSNLGDALRALGEIERDAASLNEAVSAFRAALEEWARDRLPFHWAVAQSNLAAALAVLGEIEGDTGRLEEAMSAFRDVLEYWTRERAPADWTKTSLNLAHTCGRLAEMREDAKMLSDSTAMVREAREVAVTLDSERQVDRADQILKELERIGRQLSAKRG